MVGSGIVSVYVCGILCYTVVMTVIHYEGGEQAGELLLMLQYLYMILPALHHD